MRKFFVFFMFALAVLAYFVIPSVSEESPNQEDESVVVFPNGVAVVVDIADDIFDRAKGLSGRTSLEADEGLLFLHDEADYQRYWMKDMLIPIDIIWIDNVRVVGFVEDAQPENPAETIYTSPSPVDKVLEVSAGFVSQNDLKIGDILDIVLVDE